MRNGVYDLELHHFVCQQAERPTTAAIRRRTAGQRHQVRLLCAIQLARV